MTNLSPDRPAWRAQITRERVLLLAPALLGCALAGGVFVLMGLPMLGRIQAQKQRLVELPIILSDHADWDELLQTLEDVNAPEVWVTHGREDALVYGLQLRFDQV